jgi:sugar phosphate isomerase/epimerase
MKNLLLAAFVIVTTAALGQQFGKTLKDTPGMVSFTYRNSFQKDVALTLDTIKRLGITNMEFSNLFGRTAEEIKAMLDERGMQCTSFGVGYKDLVENTNEVARNAKTLGASYVRVAWIPHDSAFTIEIAKRAVEDFNKAGLLLKEQYGLEFCYHNHGYEFQPYEKGTLFDYIVTHTDPEFVSFELDILWAFHPGADPAALLKKYGPRFKLMHVKDLKKGVKGDFSGSTSKENDVAVGTGQLNIPEIMKAAKRSAIVYYYIEDESSAVNVQVPKTLAYLKKL